ncbi:hypothetical protein CUB88_15795 [Lactiplantibacillus plantarum]|nr:hypothetical protein CUB88_15795 [Lactiplantibacillus plantarum]
MTLTSDSDVDLGFDLWGLTFKILFIIRSLKATFDDRDFVRFYFLIRLRRTALSKNENRMHLNLILSCRQGNRR